MTLNKRIYNIKAFLYATFSRLKFNLGGQLGANEIFAILDSFSIKGWRNLYSNVPDIKKINLAYLVILLSQMMSDLVNHSSPNNFIRGWANIVMAIIVTNFLTKLLWNNSTAILYYLIGSIVTVAFFGPELDDFVLEQMGFFKFTLVPVLNSVLMLVSWYLLKKSPHHKINLIFLFLAYSLFNFTFDSRSTGLVFIMISFFIYRRDILRNLSLKNSIPYVIVILVVFQGLYSFYITEVLAGNIGGEHSKKQLVRTSNPYNPINLLLSGRSEVYVATVAIADKPIFGHGSWAIDPGGKYTLLAYKMHGEEEKFDTRIQSMEGQLIIPSHSVLMGVWMTSGLLGFIAMMYIVILFYKRGFFLLKSIAIQNSPFFPLIIFYLTSSAWTFLFSPLPHIKQTLPIIIAFIIVIYRKLEISNSRELQRKRYHAKSQVTFVE